MDEMSADQKPIVTIGGQEVALEPDPAAAAGENGFPAAITVAFEPAPVDHRHYGATDVQRPNYSGHYVLLLFAVVGVIAILAIVLRGKCAPNAGACVIKRNNQLGQF
jgi:hypothetical protein